MPRPLALPTHRGVGAVVVLFTLLGIALASETPELVPLLVALALPVLAAPWVAASRARRAIREVTVTAHAAPSVVPVGAAVRLELTVAPAATLDSSAPAPASAPASRSRRQTVPLSIEHPAVRWRRRSDGSRFAGALSEDGDGPSRERLLAPLTLTPIDVPDGSAGDDDRLIGDRVAKVTSRVPTDRRGVFVLPASHAWAHDAFGLFAAPGPEVPPVVVVVHPVADHQLSWPAASVPCLGFETPNPVNDEVSRDGLGDLQGIRPYVEGDRLTLLHWPARARYGKWFVRQFGNDRAVTDHLVIDDRAGVHRRGDFEKLLGAAMGLIESALRHQRAVALSTTTGRSFEFSPVPVGLEQARLVLAQLQPRSSAGVIPTSVGVVLTTATGAATLPAHPTVMVAA